MFYAGSALPRRPLVLLRMVIYDLTWHTQAGDGNCARRSHRRSRANETVIVNTPVEALIAGYEFTLTNTLDISTNLKPTQISLSFPAPSPETSVNLSDLGIRADQSSKWQRLAEVPEAQVLRGGTISESIRQPSRILDRPPKLNFIRFNAPR